MNVRKPSWRRLLIVTIATGLLTGLPSTAALAATPDALTANGKKELAGLAQRYLQDRADRLTLPAAGIAGANVLTVVPVTADVASRLAADAHSLDARRESLRQLDGGNTRAETAIDDVRIDAKRGNRTIVTVQLTEHTKFYVADAEQRLAAGLPSYEEFALPHRLTFKQVNGRWTLQDDVPDISANGPGVSTYPNAQRRTTSAATQQRSAAIPSTTAPKRTLAPGIATSTWDASTASKARPEAAITASYNYGAMLDYANKYWYHYNNDQYRSYRSNGGDCTNFISQIVRAGGWGERGGGYLDRKDWRNWFYGDYTWTTSYTWAAATNWLWFAYNNGDGRVRSVGWEDLVTTDIIQMNFDRNDTVDHTMFITGHSYGPGGGFGDLLLTYHSNETHNESIWRIVDRNPNAWYYLLQT